MDLWSLLGKVSQHSLRSRRLEFDDWSLDRAALFPLFDDEGRTRMLMLAAEDSGRILLADWAPGVFVRGWGRRDRLRLRFADLEDASTRDEATFADLWHFDPWWVLGEPRYQGHESVPALQGTNIPGFDATVSGMAFDRDVGRASYIVTGAGDAVRVRRFTPETLATMVLRRRATRERPRAAVRAGWQLRPFWRTL
jgi:hypothetical protein